MGVEAVTSGAAVWTSRSITSAHIEILKLLENLETFGQSRNLWGMHISSPCHDMGVSTFLGC